MITKFKLFERNSYEIYGDLVNYLDDDFIEKYYNEKLAYDDVEEIISLWPNLIWNNIDDEGFVNAWKEDEINNYTIEEFSVYDFKKYLENNWNDEIENEVLKIWKENYEDDDDKYSEYSGFMLSDLNEDELKDVIQDVDDEGEFVKKTVEDRYKDEDAQSLIRNMYGDVEQMGGKDLLHIVDYYIDDEGIKKDYIEGEDFSYKKDSVGNNITDDKDLQYKIIEADKDAILNLVELFVDDDSTDNIMLDNPYKYQKMYMKKYAKANKGDDMAKANALKYINDHFGLDDRIKEKYHEHTILVDIDNYKI